MKTTEKALVYVLLLAVAILYIMHFTSEGGDEMEEAVISDTLAQSGQGEKMGSIYYVNTDSVWDKYLWVKDITEEMKKKKAQYEGQVERKYQTFEREVNEFRQKGPTMTEMELQIKQRDLVNKEAELGKLSEELEIRFMREEKEWNDKLRAKIVGFIDEKTKDRAYDYILGYSITSNIILANDSLDLTDEVINGLNEEYISEQENKVKE